MKKQTFNKSLTKNAAHASQQTLGKFDQNASQTEKESAEAIAANLENLTGNKPEIISSKKIGSFNSSYNLVIVGMPNSDKIGRGYEDEEA